LVKTGRKTTNVSRVKCAIATGLIIGNTLIIALAGPRLGAEQIEQEWWDVRELIGCEWTACTVPIAQTSAMHNTHSAWKIQPRFAGTCIMLVCDSSLIYVLDGRPVTWKACKADSPQSLF
jgi:hypothetical protein